MIRSQHSVRTFQHFATEALSLFSATLTANRTPKHSHRRNRPGMIWTVHTPADRHFFGEKLLLFHKTSTPCHDIRKSTHPDQRIRMLVPEQTALHLKRGPARLPLLILSPTSEEPPEILLRGEILRMFRTERALQ